MSELEMLDKMFDSEYRMFVPKRSAWEELCAWLDCVRDVNFEYESEDFECLEM